jgi:hypothetical protein
MRKLLAILALYASAGIPQVRIPGPAGIRTAATATPITFINSVCGPAPPTSTGGASAPVNMTGADLYVMALGIYTVPVTVSDSNGDTPSDIPSTLAGGANFVYFQNVTGGNVSFSATSSGSAYPAFCVFGFSGMQTSGVYETVDAFNSAFGSTTIQAGSVTPAATHNLLLSVTMETNSTNTVSINSGFATPIGLNQASGANVLTYASYLIQTGTAAQNPIWTYGSNSGYSIYAGTAVFQGN